MSKKPTLVVMVGNIGSGKSTIVKQVKDHGFKVVSRDDLRYMLGGGKYIFDPELEPCILESESNIIYSLMSMGYDIIVDEIGVSPRLRLKYLELAESFDYDVIAIEMPRLSKEICVERRCQNPHGDYDKAAWEGIWDKFNKIYSSPTIKEGFSKIFRLNKDITKLKNFLAGRI